MSEGAEVRLENVTKRERSVTPGSKSPSAALCLRLPVRATPSPFRITDFLYDALDGQMVTARVTIQHIREHHHVEKQMA